MVSTVVSFAAPVSRNVPPLRVMPVASAHRPWPPAPVKITLLLRRTVPPGRRMTLLLLALVAALKSDPVAAWNTNEAPFITSITLPVAPRGVEPPGAPPTSMLMVLPLLTMVPEPKLFELRMVRVPVPFVGVTAVVPTVVVTVRIAPPTMRRLPDPESVLSTPSRTMVPPLKR